MVPFRGRLKFRQYIPGKSYKYGVKLFKVCSPDGYTYNISIYSGKTDTQSKGLGETVVLNLCEDYLDHRRTMVTDNFYTSVSLAERLLERKTHLVGTMRKNRKGLSSEVVKAKLKKGEIFGKENNNGLVFAK